MFTLQLLQLLIQTLIVRLKLGIFGLFGVEKSLLLLFEFLKIVELLLKFLNLLL